MKYLFLLSFITLMIIFNGCTGPTGPAGNANVRTITFSTTLSSWSLYSSEGLAICDKTMPLITEDIQNNGLVLVYYKKSSSDFWNQWNQTIIFDGEGFMLYNLTDIGSMALMVQSTTSNGVPVLVSQTLNFKVVIIQGSASTFKMNKNTDYETIKNTYNLAD